MLVDKNQSKVLKLRLRIAESIEIKGIDTKWKLRSSTFQTLYVSSHMNIHELWNINFNKGLKFEGTSVFSVIQGSVYLHYTREFFKMDRKSIAKFINLFLWRYMPKQHSTKVTCSYAQQ